MIQIPDDYITVVLGTFRRHTTATGEGTTRIVNIADCPIEGRKDEVLEISVKEIAPDTVLWEDHAEKIGILWNDQQLLALYLHPPAFAEFWRAADCTDAALRTIRVGLRKENDNIHMVMEAGFNEIFPDPIDVAPKAKRPRPLRRIHPVVLELRTIEQKITAALYAIGIFVLVVAALRWFGL